MNQKRLPELMDNPAIDEIEHVKALQGLRRINRFSLTARHYWTIIREIAEREIPLSVLDVATGAGDVPIQLALKSRSTGLNIHFSGCDRSAAAIHFATQMARRAEAAVEFFIADAIQDSLPASDIIMCSLFLHHLDRDDAVRLLRNVAKSARKLVLISDLKRSLAGFALAYIGTRALSKSHVVRVDGPRSVRAAYSSDEAREIALEAGLKNICIRRQWPMRFLLQANP